MGTRRLSLSAAVVPPRSVSYIYSGSPSAADFRPDDYLLTQETFLLRCYKCVGQHPAYSFAKLNSKARLYLA